jgi:hypothetical protein
MEMIQTFEQFLMAIQRTSTDHDVNLGSGTPRVDDGKIYQLKDTAAVCLMNILCAVKPCMLQDLSVLNILVHSLYGTTPEHKGKIGLCRVPTMVYSN